MIIVRAQLVEDRASCKEMGILEWQSRLTRLTRGDLRILSNWFQGFASIPDATRVFEKIGYKGYSKQLYRGVHISLDLIQNVFRGRVVWKPRSLASWTTNRDVAMDFAANRYGISKDTHCCGFVMRRAIHGKYIVWDMTDRNLMGALKQINRSNHALAMSFAKEHVVKDLPHFRLSPRDMDVILMAEGSRPQAKKAGLVFPKDPDDEIRLANGRLFDIWNARKVRLIRE